MEFIDSELPRFTPRSVRRAGLLVGLLLMAACSSSADEGATDQAGSNADAADQEGTSTATAGSSDAPESWRLYESPLKAAAGLPATLVDEVEVAVERANTIAEYTRDCMESSGFEYPASTVTGAQLYNPGVFLSEAEFVEQYGFGYFAAGIDAVTGARDSRETSGSPLEQYIASLHPEARGEFFLTLYGFIPGELESTETVDRGGCEFEAEIRYNEENPISTGLETDAVLEAFEELEARLASDPRTIEATRLWSACMSAEGYSEWSSLSELRDDLSADVDRSFSNASDEDQLLDELHKGLASELEVAAVSFACEADARTLEIEARRDLESEILETLAP